MTHSPPVAHHTHTVSPTQSVQCRRCHWPMLIYLRHRVDRWPSCHRTWHALRCTPSHHVHVSCHLITPHCTHPRWHTHIVPHPAYLATRRFTYHSTPHHRGSSTPQRPRGPCVIYRESRHFAAASPSPHPLPACPVINSGCAGSHCDRSACPCHDAYDYVNHPRRFIHWGKWLLPAAVMCHSITFHVPILQLSYYY